MTSGTEIRCKTDEDMLDFMRWIRKRGGEVCCKDYEMKVLKVIRGTNNETDKLFVVDGVLGAVNTNGDASETD